MVQVISNLGSSSTSSFGSMTVNRPIDVWSGLLVFLLLACRFIVNPSALWLNKKRHKYPSDLLARISSRCETAILIQTSILLGMVSGASLVGTSDVFAAYLAGATVSWFCDDLSYAPQERGPTDTTARENGDRNSKTEGQSDLTPASHECLQPEEDKWSSVGGQKQKSSQRIPLRTLDHIGSGKAIYEKYYKPVVLKILKPLPFVSVGFSIAIT